MKKLLLLLAFFAASFVWADDIVPGEIIVKFRNEIPQKKVMKLKGVQKVKRLAPALCENLTCVHFDTLTTTTTDMLRQFEKRADVEFAVPNTWVKPCVSTATPNDSLFSEQYGPKMIRMPELWEKPLLTTKRPVIAIIDTGVDVTHPDLVENLWTNEAELNGQPGVDDDGNGYIDDIYGWNCYGDSNDLTDVDGHGTHCAGNAAATGNNKIGICGTNPDALIMVLKVGEKYLSTAAIFNALSYAAEKGADIVSMSFGTTTTYDAYRQMYKDAAEKMILVAASGNDDLDIRDIPQFPASYPFVIAVENCDENNKRNATSNYDSNGPWISGYGADEMYNYELRAPGTDIISCAPGGGYEKLTGTSMSCPMVAGAISRLMTTKNYDNRDDLVSDLILSRGDDWGCIDVMKAFEMTADQRPKSVTIASRVKSQEECGIGSTIRLGVVVNNRSAETVNDLKVKLTITNGDYVKVENGEISLKKAVAAGEIAEFSDELKYSIPAQMSLAYKKFTITLTLTSGAGTEDEISWSETISDKISIDGLKYEVQSEKKLEAAFSGVDDNRTELTIPAKITLDDKVYDITTVRYNACTANTNLKRVTLSEGLKMIELKAFYMCTNLTEINLPESVDSIEKDVFSETGLTRPVHNSHMFAYMPEDVDGTYEVPDGITKICNRAFFDSCLEEVVLPQSLKKIGESAFEGAFLKRAELPSSVEEIGNYAFSFCEDLESFKVFTSTPLPIPAYVFTLSTDIATLYVPQGSKSAYENAVGWYEFNDFEEFVIEGISALKHDAPATYYNLQGLPVTRDVPGPIIYNNKLIIKK